MREWCRTHRVHLRVLSGALSGIVDLAATDATTTMLVNVLVSVGQFQRDLQNELTREGLAAAWANGVKSGRRPQIAQLGVLDDVRRAFRSGTSVAALAREHHVSRVAIRTAVADLLPGRSEPTDDAGATDVLEQVLLTIEVPGKIARRLQALEDLGEVEQLAVRQGRAVRRGRGYSLRVTASPHTHQALLAAVADLAEQAPADRKACRIYRDRITTAAVPAGTGD